jgi:hypothetical protein|tara:strand:+ start:830 stop:967 length:138 start_codon:yes stop_codon:yes gene_type:complete
MITERDFNSALHQINEGFKELEDRLKALEEKTDGKSNTPKGKGKS